jgi:hypothetical protein
MAKCKVSTHKNLWRIEVIRGNKRTILCLACDFRWESAGEQYKNLPFLSEEEKKKRLVGLYD